LPGSERCLTDEEDGDGRELEKKREKTKEKKRGEEEYGLTKDANPTHRQTDLGIPALLLPTRLYLVV
jgi:hypothetical protein